MHGSNGSGFQICVCDLDSLAIALSEAGFFSSRHGIEKTQGMRYRTALNILAAIVGRVAMSPIIKSRHNYCEINIE